MSEKALKDHNTLLGSERKPENANKGIAMNNFVENAIEKPEEWQRKSSSSMVSTPTNGNQLIHGGGEVGTSEIEYTELENLTDVPDVDSALKAVLAGLDTKDMLQVCDTLNNVRRLALFHKEVVLNIMGDVIIYLLKSVRNRGSAAYKTTIMASGDIINAQNN